MTERDSVWLLDTSVLIRHLLQDIPDHSDRTTELIRSVERGEREVRLSDFVVAELIHVLHKRYGAPRGDVRDSVLPILELAGVVLPGKRVYAEAFELWIRERSLSFVDCYQLCLARHLGSPGVITFDRTMNRLPGVERIEP